MVPDNSLDPSTVDVYTATSVYSELEDNVYEPATAVDDHTDSDDYDVLDAQSMQPQLALVTVPASISLLSDTEAEETYTNHQSTACITVNQLSITAESQTVDTGPVP